MNFLSDAAKPYGHLDYLPNPTQDFLAIAERKLYPYRYSGLFHHYLRISLILSTIKTIRITT